MSEVYDALHLETFLQAAVGLAGSLFCTELTVNRNE